ncbi:MAG TPA: HAD-IB family phosphatase [bacterium]|nr:HAD-IB family phosphatase [bacterium]
MKPQKIVLFDLDGTLTYGISSTRFIFRRVGDEAFFEQLEHEWLKDRMDHPTLAAQVTRRMTGWKVRDLEKSLHLIPKMTGIAQTVRSLQKKGYYTALATLGYELSARYFQKRYGFNEVRGTTLEVKKGIITGKKMVIFEEHEKASFLRSLAKTFKLPLSQTAAVGDSRSDREVFKIAGFRVAINQDGFLKGLAHVDVKGRDMRQILKYL